MRQIILFILLIPALFSCAIPTVHQSYYKPVVQGEELKYSGNLCHGAAGAPTTMLWTLSDGISLELKTFKKEGNGKVDIKLTVAENTTIEWEQGGIQILADKKSIQTVEPQVVTRACKASPSNGIINWNNLIAVPTAFDSNGVPAKPFSSNLSSPFFSLKNFTPKTVSLQIPDISTSEKAPAHIAMHPTSLLLHEVIVRSLLSSSSRNRVVYMTENQLARYHKEVHQCQSNSEKSKHFSCEEAAYFKYKTFKEPLGAFQAKGRLWRFQSDTEMNNLKGYLNLNLPEKPFNFIWSGKEITLLDKATKETRGIELSTMSACSTIKAQLGDKIIGIGDRGTTVTFSMNLGSIKAQRYRIILPPLRINNQRRILKPIDLELRQFELGVLPINC
ncbi:hypothetical protein [Thiomicrorhabdus xiamenensis]|uniref:Uncharacterized protein n=1 Tax=Thiomicrorhabdus xiamenensis TaxID=2739063 RepID=A0A7D4TCA6_9GAMM|nr:hypothetical protein [Thiomicrorhabdus xiamenensis]QKI90186.1 hypothetical protein HQN79_11670 [Thiomicrorhabdus xiamenensis]